MIAPFKVSYRQDLLLAKTPAAKASYAILLVAMAVIPLVLGEFYVGELGGLFIFAIAGVGLMLLTGYTGLVSLGHAAFLGIGAYAHAIMLAQGLPFLISLPLAGLITAAFGVAIGVPTLRMSGLYLAISTLAFGSIIGTVLQKWDALTGGFDGFPVRTPTILGWKIQGAIGTYYTSLIVLVLVIWLALNILREGAHLMWQSSQGLMDEALEPEVLAEIDRTLAGFRHATIRFDHLSSRRSGQRRFIDLHMHMPSDWTLRRAAAVRGSVEQALMSAVPGLRATIQLLPNDVEVHSQDEDDLI